MAFVKRSDVKEITVKSYGGRSYKKFDEATQKYLVSPTPQVGFSEVHKLEIVQGTMEVSGGNLGDMLKGVLDSKGNANIIDQTYTIKTNGKTGKDIRYYFNHKVETKTAQQLNVQATEDVITDENGVAIPF